MLYFKTRLKINKAKAKLLKGIFSSDIPYEVRVPSGDSSPFFGNYVGQKYGSYDTNTCWDFSLTEIIETQLAIERSLKRFSDDDIAWFKEKGYIDEDGDFYLSRRWIAILSGVKDNGNDQAIGWILAAKYGMIPFKMLPFELADLQGVNNRTDFINKYFSLDSITPEMIATGKEFLKRVKIQSEELGTRWNPRTPDMLSNALLQASLQVGIPVNPSTWNNSTVNWDGSKKVVHSAEFYKYSPGTSFPYHTYDSYEPHLKELSSDYYIPLITRGIVTAIAGQMLSPKLSTGVWQQFVALLRRLGVI